MGSIPSQETKIPSAEWLNQKKRMIGKTVGEIRALLQSE